MMRKALMGLAVLAAVATAVQDGQAQDWQAQDWQEWRAGQSNGSETASPASAIRQSFRSFLRQTPRPVPKMAQTPLNDVCRLPSGFVCIVTPQPVYSVCLCGSAQGVIEPLQ